jgi:hypothetical protein
LLTDPFYIAAPLYSGSSTGVSQFTYGSSYVAAGLAIKGQLESAGWTVVDSAPSVAVQARPGYYFSNGDISGTPVEMTPAQCTTTRGPGWARASAAGLIFNSYNPGALIPTCAGGTGGIAWYPYDTTTEGTAGNLVDKLNEMPYWVVSGSTIAGGDYQFTFLSTAPAFEFDEVPIFMAGGDETMRRGYYTLRSPALDGVYLEIKIETRTLGHLGGFIVLDGLGAISLLLTVTSSGGGTPFQTPFYPGTYNICANNHQLLIWPVAGMVATTRSNYSVFVSLIEPPEEHPVAGVGAMAISNDTGDLNTRPDHFRQTLRWDHALGCGYNGQLFATAYRVGHNDGYQKMAMLVRGTKGRPTLSLGGQPLIESPYVMLPANPRTGPGPMIAGKLWDIVMTTGNAPVGKTMMYDGRKWTCFSTSVPVGDVLNDMWVLTDAG